MVSHAVLHLNNKDDATIANNDNNNDESKQASDDEEETLTVESIANPSSITLPQSLIGSLTTLTIHIYNIEEYDPLSLASLTPNLRKDGQGRVHLHCYDLEMSSNGKVQNSIVLAGLTPESELKQSKDCRVFTARWKSRNESSSGRIGGNRLAKVQRISTKKSVVKINAFDDDDDDDDDEALIDEDDLLNFESSQFELEAPPEIDMEERKMDYDDCGGRAPCDNCTCGRAERENGTSSATSAPPPSTSACGNCSKGDAFRCAGCPHLGKPAFVEGEEALILDLMDDF